MPSREENPDHLHLPVQTKDSLLQAGLLAPGSMCLAAFPVAQWLLTRNSPVTVAGTAPALNQLPYYALSGTCNSGPITVVRRGNQVQA